MDYSPLQVKRILKYIRVRFENYILNKQDTLDLKKNESWLDTYLELSDKDKINILKKVDRIQASTIVEAMGKKDVEIFVPQLGKFFIKPTTIAFYSKLDELIKEQNGEPYDYKELEAKALLHARDTYYRLYNAKQNGKAGRLKISPNNKR